MFGKVCLFSLALFVGAVVAQDECPLDTYCGQVCCDGTIGIPDRRCCATTNNPMLVSSVCCAAEQNNEVNTCGNTRCPDDLSPDLVYDTAVQPAELRNQCCLYFRDGCCSQSENNFLDLLFKLALGLGIGLGGLLVIILILVVCCCCCICCE